MAVPVSSHDYRSSLRVAKVAQISAAERFADLVSSFDSLDERTLVAAFDILDGKRVAESNTKAARLLGLIASLTRNSDFVYATRSIVAEDFVENESDQVEDVDLTSFEDDGVDYTQGEGTDETQVDVLGSDQIMPSDDEPAKTAKIANQVERST